MDYEQEHDQDYDQEYAQQAIHDSYFEEEGNY